MVATIFVRRCMKRGYCSAPDRLRLLLSTAASVQPGPQPGGTFSYPFCGRIVGTVGDGPLEQVGSVVVSTPELTQLGEGAEVGWIGRDPDPDVEEPVELARAAAAERDSEVVEHPLHDRSRGNRVEVARIEDGLGPVQRSEPGVARTCGDPGAVEVRVDEPVAVVAFAHEEMAGHAHADELDTEPPTDLHEHHGQRDGHPDSATKHLVEIGVAGIVVVGSVAVESFANEDVLDETVDGRLRARGRDVVERGDAGPDVGVAVGSRCGQKEQRLVERDLAVARQDVGQAVGGGHEATVANYGGRVPSIHPYLAVAQPIAFAHRGGASAHPENTERAFRHALDLGYTHIETDVHVTRDGVAIAFHDDRLDRVTDAVGVIAELTWEQVKESRVDGTEPIMRLDELFETFPDAYINLDPKHDAAVDPLAATILATGAVDRVMVGSFSDRRIADVRRRVGDSLAVSAGPRLTAKLVAESRGLRVKSEWAHAAQVPLKVKGVPLVTGRFVDHLHRRGMHVHVWTVNDADEMHLLLDLGVDGIMTDHPEVLRDVLRDRGVWPGG